MSYNLPKTKKGQKLFRHLALFATRGNYKTGMWYTKEAKQMPDNVMKFIDPHGEDVTEDQFIEAAEDHIKKHGFRIDPVYVDTINKYKGYPE